MAAYTENAVARLQRARLEAFRDWLALYTAEGCLADPSRRDRMLDARRRYQDAAVEHAWALRSLGPAPGA